MQDIQQYNDNHAHLTHEPSTSTNNLNNLALEDGKQNPDMSANAETDCLAVVCICGSDIDDNGTIQCDKCGRWQHMRCVGVDPHSLEDIEDLIYLCDVCDPRPLDVNAAKDYIEHYQKQEAQASQVKPRRGRGKGSGKRGNHANSGTRPDTKRSRSSKQIDSDATDDMNEQPITNTGGLRDYTLIDTYKTTEDAYNYINEHISTFPPCPYDAVPQPISTSIKSISSSQSHGLFIERDAPASAFVGSYLGLVDTQSNYKPNPQNKYQYLRGPTGLVVFVDETNLLVDARSVGNEFRYLRKSCAPNCRILPLAIQPRSEQAQMTWRISVVLTQAVKAGDEICVGFQWETEDPEDMPALDSNGALRGWAQDVLSMIGDCACGRTTDECLVARNTPEDTRKRSFSKEVDRHEEPERPPSADIEQQPMTREERKIQMAIARMENADVPKVKRRRRNTGDESNRPTSARRVSSKADDAETPAANPRRSFSPAETVRTPRARVSMKPRGKLIRSPSPDYATNDMAPRKDVWLRSYLKEKAKQDQQKAKLVLQAKEAAERLEREATQRKLEIEAKAREIREAKEREAEVARRQAEREATEAQRRARDREIWGDNPLPPRFDHSYQEQLSPGMPGPPLQVGVTASPSVDTRMAPPQTPSIEAPQASPPAVPQVVKKLSISEYMRLRGKASSDAAESPTAPSQPATPVTAAPQAEENEKSDGEVEAGEVEAGEIQVKHELVPPTGPRDHHKPWSKNGTPYRAHSFGADHRRPPPNGYPPHHRPPIPTGPKFRDGYYNSKE